MSSKVSLNVKYNEKKCYAHGGREDKGEIGHTHPPSEEITKNISKLSLDEARKIFTQIKDDIAVYEEALKGISYRDDPWVAPFFRHEKHSDEALLVIVTQALKDLTSKVI